MLDLCSLVHSNSETKFMILFVASVHHGAFEIVSTYYSRYFIIYNQFFVISCKTYNQFSTLQRQLLFLWLQIRLYL